MPIKEILLFTYLLSAWGALAQKKLITNNQIQTCTIKNRNKTFQIKIEPEIVNKKQVIHYSKISIYKLRSHAPEKKLLFCDRVSTSLIKKYKNCNTIWEGNQKQMLIAGNFYSSDSGKTFHNISDFAKNIKKQYDSELHEYYAELYDGLIETCGNATEGKHTPQIMLAMYFNTVKDSDYIVRYNSSDGGNSWNYMLNIPYFVEQIPEFPGDLKKYISQNINYPVNTKNKGINGTVILTFVINKDGSLSNIHVIKGLDRACDSEAVRLVRNMPKWIPGKNKGKTVKVVFALPITFKP